MRSKARMAEEIGMRPYLALLAGIGSDRFGSARLISAQFDRAGPVLIGRQPQELQELN